jgi:aminoglycoside phosphotransferase (APT) family kinase protein
MAESELHILDRLRRDGLVSEHAIARPLAGGVSSDVFLIEDRGKQFVVKQALPRLKVKEDWQADVSRNRFEYEFLRFLSGVVPSAAAKVLATGTDYFAMEYLGAGYQNWKHLLLEGNCQQQHAVQAAQVLGTIHRASYKSSDLAKQFATTPNFHQLRTDPYLLHTGRGYPKLQSLFEEEAVRLDSTHECLVHGDYSPKNMLIGRDRFVLLDCEVAWYGDPAFDVAFLLNHLLLKALFHAPHDVALRPMFGAFTETYFDLRKLERGRQEELDFRTARLLLMLLLARVDGKSPVEYLTEDKRDFVRDFVQSRLAAPRFGLRQVASDWFASLNLQKPGVQ